MLTQSEDNGDSCEGVERRGEAGEAGNQTQDGQEAAGDPLTSSYASAIDMASFVLPAAHAACESQRPRRNQEAAPRAASASSRSASPASSSPSSAASSPVISQSPSSSTHSGPPAASPDSCSPSDPSSFSSSSPSSPSFSSPFSSFSLPPQPGGREARRVQPMSRAVAEGVCSQQVVLGIKSICKELVENAIDAGATGIEVRFINGGLESIEVRDNGSGIAPQDFPLLGRRHATSKIDKFEDLYNSLDTMGFRGEALASLCALSDVTILTRTAADAFASRLFFDHHGNIVQTEPAAREVGTTVTVTNLFASLPLRRRALQQQRQKHFQEALAFLQKFALLHASDCRVLLTDFQSSAAGGGEASQRRKGGNTVTLLNTRGTAAQLMDAAVSVYGARQMQQCAEVNLRGSDPKRAWSANVLLSRPPLGIRTSALQLFFVNKRVVDFPPLLQKLINKKYREVCSRSYFPIVIAFVNVAPHLLEVNLRKDKQEVLLAVEKEITEAILASITDSVAPVVASFQTLASLQASPQSAAALQPCRPSPGSPFGSASPPDTSSSPSEPLEAAQKGAKHEGEGAGEAASRPPLGEAQARERCRSHDEDETTPRDAVDGSSATREETDGATKDDASESSRSRYAVFSEDDSFSLFSSPAFLSGFADRSAASSAAELFSRGEKEASRARESEGTAAPRTRLRRDVSPHPADDDPAGEASCSRANLEFETRGGCSAGASASPSAAAEAASSSLSASSCGTCADGAQASTFFAEPPSPRDAEAGDRFASPPASKRFRAREEEEAKGTEEAREEDVEDAVAGEEQNAEEEEEGIEREEALRRKRRKKDKDKKKRRRERRSTQAPGVSESKLLKETVAAVVAECQLSEADLACVYGEDAEPSEAAEGDTAAGAAPASSSFQFASCPAAFSFASASDARVLGAFDPSTSSFFFNKAAFAEMKIIGQFNCGFILGCLVSRVGKPEAPSSATSSPAGGEVRSLFIVDQHASDEKKRFEDLNAAFKPATQPLLRPLRLQLPLDMERAILEFEEHIRLNGFRVKVENQRREGGETGEGDASECTFSLTGLPVVEGTQLKEEDFVEFLASLLHDEEGSAAAARWSGRTQRETGEKNTKKREKNSEEGSKEGDGEDGESCEDEEETVGRKKATRAFHHRILQCRPKKVWDILASSFSVGWDCVFRSFTFSAAPSFCLLGSRPLRACRSAIMIGDALNVSQMQQILRNLAKLHLPFNCPHGRPTVRHLFDLHLPAPYADDAADHAGREADDAGKEADAREEADARGAASLMGLEGDLRAPGKASRAAEDAGNAPVSGELETGRQQAEEETEAPHHGGRQSTPEKEDSSDSARAERRLERSEGGHPAGDRPDEGRQVEGNMHAEGALFGTDEENLFAEEESVDRGEDKRAREEDRDETRRDASFAVREWREEETQHRTTGSQTTDLNLYELCFD
ncbi:hypothetical protein BESB_036840 [Besnoitia besnoiti]|uniref:DNA mismatch repair protein, C-terminal domain-containing protein n=1 Tax=Besnoitia besnoiti TaxID=94643 RepID=A0A2A9MMB0_BESBE|nr:hypothetical protein BESB_036840 [Besnoitia besnoiti]PFH37226.1 hypothetical protein BESB_036840 [Besnoitia besnoiti]